MLVIMNQWIRNASQGKSKEMVFGSGNPEGAILITHLSLPYKQISILMMIELDPSFKQRQKT
jgi:hypothetical protein